MFKRSSVLWPSAIVLLVLAVSIGTWVSVRTNSTKNTEAWTACPGGKCNVQCIADGQRCLSLGGSPDTCGLCCSHQSTLCPTGDRACGQLSACPCEPEGVTYYAVSSAPFEVCCDGVQYCPGIDGLPGRAVCGPSKDYNSLCPTSGKVKKPKPPKQTPPPKKSKPKKSKGGGKGSSGPSTCAKEDEAPGVLGPCCKGLSEVPNGGGTTVCRSCIKAGLCGEKQRPCCGKLTFPNNSECGAYGLCK
jgi:hypothetical protein